MPGAWGSWVRPRFRYVEGLDTSRDAVLSLEHWIIEADGAERAACGAAIDHDSLGLSLPGYRPEPERACARCIPFAARAGAGAR